MVALTAEPTHTQDIDMQQQLAKDLARRLGHDYGSILLDEAADGLQPAYDIIKWTRTRPYWPSHAADVITLIHLWYAAHELEMPE